MTFSSLIFQFNLFWYFENLVLMNFEIYNKIYACYVNCNNLLKKKK